MNVDEIVSTDGAKWRAEIEGQDAVDYSTVQGHSRRGWQPAAAVAALVAVVAGLIWVVSANSGHRSTDSSARAGTEMIGATRDPLVPSMPASPFGPVSPAVTLAPDVPAGSLNMPWNLAAISADGRTLAVFYAKGDGDCVTPEGFTVDETDQYVVINAVSRRAPGRTECAASLALRMSVINLHVPLASRQLLHPAVATDWIKVLDSW